MQTEMISGQTLQTEVTSDQTLSEVPSSQNRGTFWSEQRYLLNLYLWSEQIKMISDQTFQTKMSSDQTEPGPLSRL